VALARGVRALRLENELLAATVLVDKGADISELVSKPRGVDVLWKSPWGLSRPGGGVPTAPATQAAWIEAYEGGWQEIFPSGGGPCAYKGVELNFHGEASVVAWDHEVVTAGGEAAEVRLSVRLRRSPFLIERTMRVEAGRPDLLLRERIANQGREPMDYMWGHHPAFGAPFLSGACRIDVGARSLRADDVLDGPFNPLTPDARSDWPEAARDGRTTDLSRVPGEDEPRHLLGYFEAFEGDHGWYGLTNPDLGFGVGLVWPTAVFPFAWFWQEMHATAGFPWYRGVYVMAIEPFSSIPGQGLTVVMEKTGTHRTLAAGETVEAELRAVFYESRAGIRGIGPDGTVEVREE
jgi:hypothetical protein